MKPSYFLLSLLLALAHSQITQAQRSFGVGTGFSYDYGLNFPSGTKYQPYTKGETSAFSFDGWIRIPLGAISITPTYIYSIPGRTMLVDNPDGDYIPEGYIVEQPYDPNSPYVYFSEDYEDLSAHAEIWQKTYGSFVTLNLGPYVGLGSGIFMRKRETRIFQTWMYDEYLWLNTDGVTDTYSYWDTHYYYPEEQILTTKDLTFPLILNFEGQWGYLSSGASFIWWLGGGGDKYVSFRYTMGITF